jgi:hypothetical protein
LLYIAIILNVLTLSTNLSFTKIMTAARKSAAAKNSWFGRNLILLLGQERSSMISRDMQKNSIASRESTVVHPKRKRNSPKKISTTLVNEELVSTLEKNSDQKTAAKTTNTKNTNININGQSNHEQLHERFNAASVPIWLLRLQTVYRYSSALTFLFVTSTLVVYGWTVYSQELWSEYYRTLQSLQRHERQLNTTNAALMKKIAEEGEKTETGLRLPTPGETIFLPSISPSPSPQSLSSTRITNSKVQPQTSTSLGY